MKFIKYALIVMLMAPLAIFGQGKQQNTYFKKNKLTWNTKPFELMVTDPKTGMSKLKMVDERSTLHAWNDQPVTLTAPKGVVKTIEKHISKSMSKKDVERPKFGGRDVKIHFQNYVIDTTGKMVYYEVLIYPYRQSLQLYPNEYTPEIKAYLKAVEECAALTPNVGPQKQPIYVQDILEL